MAKKQLKMTASRPFWILFMRNLSWVILVRVLTCCSICMAVADQEGGTKQAPPPLFSSYILKSPPKLAKIYKKNAPLFFRS